MRDILGADRTAVSVRASKACRRALPPPSCVFPEWQGTTGFPRGEAASAACWQPVCAWGLLGSTTRSKDSNAGG